ncbi:MAG: D-alanyl-D-alanine carboxypeptidase family protein [Clostridiaceae bacterium]
MIKKGLLAIVLTLSVSIFNNFTVSAEGLNTPQITAEYALTYDVATNEVIYSKGGDVRAYPASLTKLMSAILLTQNKKPTDILYYTENSKIQQPSSVDAYYKSMSIGEEVSADLVLKSMLMVSANDMTTVAAENIPNLKATNDNIFIKMMNEKAKEFKMDDTNFVTPNGLDDYTNDHLTTAYDLSLLANEAYKIPYIVETSRIPEIDVSISGSAPLKFTNTNKFVNPKNPLYDPTCIASKTGYTDKAGKCLVSLFERNGRKIIGVILKAPYGEINSFEDMSKIINYSYDYAKSNLVAVDPYSKESTTYKKDVAITTIPLTYKLFKTFGPTKTKNVTVSLKDDINFYKNEFNDKYMKMDYSITGSVFRDSSDSPIGTLNITLKDKSYSYPLYSDITTKNIIDDNLNTYILICGVLPISVIILIIGSRQLYLYKRKKRKRSEIQHIIDKYKK